MSNGAISVRAHSELAEMTADRDSQQRQAIKAIEQRDAAQQAIREAMEWIWHSFTQDVGKVHNWGEWKKVRDAR